MRVKLIQIDKTNFPNLALMKISAYHKKRGDSVGFEIENPELVYISSVFTWNRGRVRDLISEFKCPVRVGGWANSPEWLPPEIEFQQPDYSLYDLDYSMGFTSRGCIRNCKFCIVPRFEGRIRSWTPIWSFHHLDHSKVMLLDNNFLASPSWRDNWKYILDYDLKVCIIQGLDARLIDEEVASLLSKGRIYDKNFRDKLVYTAWDDIREEESVLQGIRNLINAGFAPSRILVYVLVGFNSSPPEDLYRFQKLLDLGVRPFVMPFNKIRNSPFIRWGQRPTLYLNISYPLYLRLFEMGFKHPEEIYFQLKEFLNEYREREGYETNSRRSRKDTEDQSPLETLGSEGRRRDFIHSSR